MISLMYCGNSKIFKGLLISALSVAMHTDRALDVHLLTVDYTELEARFTPLSEDHRAFLEKALQEYNQNSHVTLHRPDSIFKQVMADSPNLHSVYTPYTMLRLFADELPIPDKILYLDTDTAAIGDISVIFDTDLEGYDYGGVLDYLGKVFINPHYINAGVLLLNMKEIRNSRLFIRAREFIAAKKTFFPDQDAINRLEKHKYFLPRGFNEQRKMRKDTVIRHFSKSIRWLPFYHTVNIKPWNIEELHSVYRTFEFDDVLEIYLKKAALWKEMYGEEL